MSKEYIILFKKIGLFRYISALDTITMIERTFRRSKLSLCYTEGFHPKPKFSYIDPVPTGVIDLAFYFKVCFEEIYDPLQIYKNIEKVQPKFLRIRKVFNKITDLSKINRYQFSLIIKKPFHLELDKSIEKKTKRGVKIIPLSVLDNVELFEKKDYIVLNYIIDKGNLFNPYQLSKQVYLSIRKEVFVDNIPVSDLLTRKYD
ncbi:MAG: hypothetical protein PWP54_452 [Thermosipho sp. (in: thermotogales)]|nr:hypothetical protein [Thermosipho sp. (in: thermotogales)]